MIKEDDAVEQLHQEKRELQEKLDKLEKVLHSLNRRQSDAKRFSSSSFILTVSMHDTW